MHNPFRYLRNYTLALCLLAVAHSASSDSKDTLKSIRAKKPVPKKPAPRASVPRKAAPRAATAPRRPANAAAARKSLVPSTVRSTVPAPKPPQPLPPPVEDSLAQGRVAWWPMEGDARDIVGGNDDQFRRGVSAVQGTRGVALQFDGNKSGINIPDNLPLQLNDSFSISAWVTVFSYLAEGRALQIFFRGDSRAGLDPYSLYLNHLGQLAFLVDSGSGDTRVHARIPLRTVTHVSATLDTATQQMRLYLNGKLTAETRTTHRPFRTLDPKWRPGIAIGNTQSAGEHEQAFYGVLDEVQIHNRALTADEVARLARP